MYLFEINLYANHAGEKSVMSQRLNFLLILYNIEKWGIIIITIKDSKSGKVCLEVDSKWFLIGKCLVCAQREKSLHFRMWLSDSLLGNTRSKMSTPQFESLTSCVKKFKRQN